MPRIAAGLILLHRQDGRPFLSKPVPKLVATGFGRSADWTDGHFADGQIQNPTISSQYFKQKRRLKLVLVLWNKKFRTYEEESR